MAVYLDVSALVKLLCLEIESDPLRGWLAGTTDDRPTPPDASGCGS